MQRCAIQIDNLYLLPFYLSQAGYVFARLCLFVCLSFCLCVSKITQKVMDRSFWNFLKMSEWQKLPVIQFWG